MGVSLLGIYKRLITDFTYLDKRQNDLIKMVSSDVI